MNNRIRIAIFLALSFSGVNLFLATPKNVFAVDNPEEGYGWGRIVTTTGTSNQIVYNVFDSVTRAAISADSVSITLVEAYTATPQANITWSCSAPCPVSHTFTVPNNTFGGMWIVYSMVQKSGYHTTLNPANYYNGPLTYTGSQTRNYNIYLTDNSKSYQFKKVFPVMGTWYNYPPPHISRANPAFTNSLGPWTAGWVRVHQPNLSVISGPAVAPFPATFNFVPQPGITDGVTPFWGAGTKDDSDALSGNTPITWYGMDRVPPTVICSISPSGSTSNTAITVAISASDPLSGVGAGDAQVRVNGGAWTAMGIPNSGNVTANFTYTATPGNSYSFQYRARDKTINSSGLNNQWSAFNNCGSTMVTSQDFTISVLPANQTVVQGDSSSSYLVTVQGSGGFSGVVTLSHNNLSANGISFIPNVTPPINIAVANGSGSALFTVQTLVTTPVNPYTLTITGTSGALTHSASATLVVTKLTPQPWLQTTKGDVGSVGAASGSINMNIVSPLGSNSTSLVVAKFVTNNFSSAKNWLVNSYLGGVNIGLGSYTDYYQYFWDKFGASQAQTVEINPATTTVCTPPSTYGFTTYGFINSNTCVIGNLSSFQTGGGLYNGSFVINGDVTYNLDLHYDGTNSKPPCCGIPRAGDAVTLDGNPTVIFVTGTLYINKDIKTTGNKKIIFIVKGNGNSDTTTNGSVQVNPLVSRIDAFIVTNGKFNSFKWLNQRNADRYEKMKKIEEKVKAYQLATGKPPLAAATDTSDGCSTRANGDGGSPPVPSGSWYSTLNAVGNTNWDGKTSGTNNIDYPCSATQGLRYLLNTSVGSYVGGDINVPGCAPGTLSTTTCIDPTNGAVAGIPGKNAIPGDDGTVKRPKRFAIQYKTWNPSGPAAYDIFAAMEDDASYDQGSIQADPEFHICGGDYNKPIAGNFLKSQDGNFCYKHNLIVNGSVIAQGGFSLGRDSRDDNNSSYQVTANCPSPGAASDHCPTPAEAINYDPSYLYLFAKETAGQRPLLGIEDKKIKEVQP